MDKKNSSIAIVLIIAAFVCYYISSRYAPPSTSPAVIRQAVAQQTAAAGVGPLPSGGTESAFASASGEHTGATVTRLENDFIEVRFTNFGGAIRDVAFKKYPAALGRPDPFIFNDLHKDPMLAFVDQPGLDRGTRFELVSKTDTEVVFRAVVGGTLQVTRRYVLSPNKVGATDPYQIYHETIFKNLAGTATAPLRVVVALGTTAPLNATDIGQYLTTGYSNGNDQGFTQRAQLQESNGIFGLRAHPAIPEISVNGPLVWASVSSQFFACVLTPTQPAAGLVSRRVKLLSRLPDTDFHAYGITGDAQFDLSPIAPHGETKLSGEFYVGPKEYHRLANQDVFKANQDKVMHYGGWFISFFSGILITLMTWTHSFVPNWGLAIICTTLILKTVFLPFTLMQARSARRMQKIQPELKLLREKYKDNPQKQQTATMELFKQHKVNPMGGCLPMLITMPFFFGFYTMLRSTAELRFAPFLWSHDLSAPDTIGHFLGYPINILPILFTATSFLQMQVTPQPTVDSSQARMMKFMPLVFMFIYYGFSCSLSLYSTVNGLFTIGQQLVINRKKDDGDPASAGASAGGARAGGGFSPGRPAYGKGSKPMTNVTPKKKK